MTKARDPEALLTAYLAIGMDVLPDRVADSVMDEVHRTRQRVVLRPWRRRPVSRTTFAAAMAVAAVMVGSAFFVIQRGQPAIIGPAPTASPSTLPSQPAVVAPTATAPPSPEVSPSPAALGAKLTWTKVDLDQRSPRVAWLGDRFVLADQDSGAVYTSTDGIGWDALQPGDTAQGYVDLLRGSFASWQESAVGWWNPEDREGPDIAGAPPITARDTLVNVRPPDSPTSTTPFKGRIESIGMGPSGIVAQVHSHLDWDNWVRKKLGARTNNEWVTHVESVDFRNGILRIKMDNGPGLKVVWADEGLEPGDYQDRGFGWYSPDGEQWTAMAPSGDPGPDSGSSLPTGGFGSVVGVSDGFIATGAYPARTCADPDGSCTGMWYSSDGLTWRRLGTAPELVPFSEKELCIRDGCGSVARQLLPWKGGALAIDGDGRIAIWSSGGPAELQIPAQRDGTVATGPLGLVSIGDGQVLVSRDGIDYKVSSIPAEMSADGSGRGGMTVAVGERSVLVLVGESLWLGTPEP